MRKSQSRIGISIFPTFGGRSCPDANDSRLSMCPPSPCPNEQHDTDNQDCCDANRPNHRRIKRDAENEIRVRSVCVHGVCSGLTTLPNAVEPDRTLENLAAISKTGQLQP